MSAVLGNPHAPTPALPISVDERRKYQARIAVQLDLLLTTVDTRSPATSVNLSVTGLLIDSAVRLKMHERVIVTVMDEQGQPSCHLCAEVVRAAPPDSTAERQSYGLRILSDDARIWHELLRQLVLS